MKRKVENRIYDPTEPAAKQPMKKYRQRHHKIFDLNEEDNIVNPEMQEQLEAGMGPDGDLLLDLIQDYKPKTYKELLTSRVARWELRWEMSRFNVDLRDLMQEGYTEYEAKEFIWLPLCQLYGIR